MAAIFKLSSMAARSGGGGGKIADLSADYEIICTWCIGLWQKCQISATDWTIFIVISPTSSRQTSIKLLFKVNTLYSPCPVRSDRQTTSLTLTTGVCKACTKWRVCEHHEYSLWRHRLTDCGMEVTLRSDCLASRSWAGKRGVLNT